jgi:hypothetical protein
MATGNLLCKIHFQNFLRFHTANLCKIFI